MLIRFAVENYASFKERQVFSMVAGKQTRHPSHCVNINGKRLLKSSFLFGANASGKSNFVHALDFMCRITLIGTGAIRYNDRCFRIAPEYKTKPGVFQVDFISHEKVYSYGYAINYNTLEICSEWLYRIESADKEVCIFEREQGEETRTDLRLNGESKTRFSIYAADIQKDKLFLEEIGTKNFNKESEFSDFIYAYEWFKGLIIIYPDSYAYNKNDIFLNSASNTENLSNLLSGFDTGIEKIEKMKQPVEEALSFLPDELKKDILNRITQDFAEKNKENDNTEDIEIRIKIMDDLYNISEENGEFIAEKIMMDHGNPAELFGMSEESDGTKRLFDLIPMYEEGQKEKVIIVDELDRSLHSRLTEKFVELFFSKTEKDRSQLICTTHDLNLMDLRILRQDEIWFIERERDHSSRIYSLSDFKQRFDKNIINDYLIGRYGAIPCFNDEDWQVDDE